MEASGESSGSDPSRDSSAVLFARVRAGDRGAVDLLLSRYLPALRNWAHSRLPRGARDLADTDDLIQETLVRAVGRLEHFEPRPGGGFPAYLRQIFLNLIRDEIRRIRRQAVREDLDDAFEDPRPTPFEEMVGRDTAMRYEQALSRLSADHQSAVTLRLEFGLSYADVGGALGRSANAARLLVVRAVMRLAEEMQHDG